MTFPTPFVSAETAAKLCEISTGTWRAWVERGVVPPAAAAEAALGSQARAPIERLHLPAEERADMPALGLRAEG